MPRMWSRNSWRASRKRSFIAFYTSSVGPGQEFIEKIEMLCTYYRGRTTFTEMMNMPLSYINSLYNIAIKQQADEELRKQKEAEVVEDGLEETLT